MSPQHILQQYWGYAHFRPLQEDIIQSILSGKDTLAILPTGGGKSICYQVPGLLKEGITIVISPLIALMKDQVENLNKKDIKAIAIFSGMKSREIDTALDNCIHGNIKFLYVSPERLETDLFQVRLKRMNVSLIAVDEAHCISQWGYDFRPSYLKIATIRESLKNIPIIALTASATPIVQQDIVAKLLFTNHQHFLASFERKNLCYVVRTVEDKYGKLKEILEKISGTAIVYAATRKRTIEIADYLKKNKFQADFYNAGLQQEVRSKKQDAWVNNKTRIIVSTNAFGMGIDKPDVRSVIHMDMPESMEAYYQEAGRAGRDGKKAYAVLIFNTTDKLNIEQKLKQHFPTFEEIQNIYDALGNYFKLAVGSGQNETFEFDITAFSAAFKFSVNKILMSLKLLEQQSILSISEAIFIPSRIKIKANRMNLYNFQLKHQDYDLLIKLILRTAQGVMDNYIAIKENDFAKVLKFTAIEIREMLLYLNKVNMIDYIPSIDMPTITFIQPRNFAKYLHLDRNAIDERKKVFDKQLRGMLNYASNKQICRSKTISAYFGEEANRCGVCDICLELNKMKVSELKFEQLHQKIETTLSVNSLPLERLCTTINDFSKENIIDMVKWLMDNGQIILTDKKELKWLY